MIKPILSSMSLDEVTTYLYNDEYCGQDVLDLYEENAKLRARVERLEKVRDEARSVCSHRLIPKENDPSCGVVKGSMWEKVIRLRTALKDCEETDIDSVTGQGSTVRPEDFQVTDELIERLRGAEC